MPLEIRELIIKASVNNEGGPPSGTNNTNAGTNESMINEVAEKVFEIIKEKTER